jgi:glycosyltransferase involved in cell wall biosynthesis
VPKTRIPAILAAADAGLMTLFRSPLIHIYFENKFIDTWGPACRSSLPWTGCKRFDPRAGAGRVVPTFDAEALANAIVEAADHRSVCREMGAAGLRFLETRLRQPDVLNRYADLLEAVAKGEAARLPPGIRFQ